ncbi:MAG: phosphoribosyl-AMP cyclohydrolase, partial [Methanoregulaceae archaeon]|nr:phosphoribosyl-AMP cyclohydrolase [Methanoregulaceae archaeon]
MKLNFSNDLIPVVVQDIQTREVLMVAYANRNAVELTRSTGYAHYYSRSRKKMWKKGEESGHFQKVARILVDCDEDCLIYEVEQT